jgi:hypothetical protein
MIGFCEMCRNKQHNYHSSLAQKIFPIFLFNVLEILTMVNDTIFCTCHIVSDYWCQQIDLTTLCVVPLCVQKFWKSSTHFDVQAQKWYAIFKSFLGSPLESAINVRFSVIVGNAFILFYICMSLVIHLQVCNWALYI